MTLPSPGTTAVLAAAIAIMVATAAGNAPPTSAQTGPIVSVDAVSDAANTATAVGTVDTCLSTTTGATFDADVVIQGVTNISGFQADLLYDPNVLKVTAVDYNFLLASTGASVLPLGNSTPDTDGDFFMAAAMFSLISVTGADGDGVLARVTFEAVNSGSSPLDLDNVKLADADGNPIPPTNANNFYIGPVNDGSVTVDASCSPDDDSDGIVNAEDNCPTVANGPNETAIPGVGNQTNTDADLGTAGATIGGVPIGDDQGDACDDDDDDDGSTDSVEGFLGTDPLDNCGPNAWPPDTDNNGVGNGYVDNVDFLPIVAAWLTSSGDPGYNQRADMFDANGVIDNLDFLPMVIFWLKSCT